MLTTPFTNVKTQERCDEIVNNTLIKFSGTKTSKIYLSNPKRLRVETVKVDGCYITVGKRCDWFARTFGKGAEEIYIELKRTRMNEAIEQLVETIRQLSSDIQKTPKRCVIVQTCNQVYDTRRQKYASQFKSRFNARLKFERHGSTILVNA
jgi:hypothetical protein